jgi:8-oxo-dGTP diphosphatase
MLFGSKLVEVLTGMDDSVDGVSTRIRVAVAVLRNERRQVLVCQRPADVHQGGLWEFPGGKMIAGERIEQTLRREILEELGVTINEARPLIRIPYDYREKKVLLDVWLVKDYSGIPTGREGQVTEWVDTDELHAREFPAANRGIIQAVRLPDRYLITPEPDGSRAVFLRQLDRALARGVTLVQLRARHCTADQYRILTGEVLAICAHHGAHLLLNAAPHTVAETGAAGVHLSGQWLRRLHRRPLPQSCWVGASCHNAEELAHACAIGADFVVVSAVRRTPSHAGVRPIGFHGLHSLTEISPVPVYALGGMQVDDVETACKAGAQGIAAIRGLWA